MEARTRSLGRTDIIVDYRGEHQVVEYLEDYGLQTGYLLSFNFNQKKQIGVWEMEVEGRKIIEAVV